MMASVVDIGVSCRFLRRALFIECLHGVLVAAFKRPEPRGHAGAVWRTQLL